MEQDTTGDRPANQTALKAAEAGVYLANALGLPEQISEQGMWQYARSNAIPAIRIGRRIWFLPRVLDEFISNGGTARGKQDGL